MEQATPMVIATNKIFPNPHQPRKYFDEEELEKLAESIKNVGLLEPIMVRPVDDHYEIVHGERRWRAASSAGLPELQALVRPLTDQEAFELSLAENVQREGLTPLEEADAYRELQAQGQTQEQIARKIGKTQSYVAHKIRLLDLPDYITRYVRDKTLSEQHIRQVMKLKRVYGHGVMRDLTEVKGSLADSANYVNSEWAEGVLHYLRPEEYGLLFSYNAVSSEDKIGRVITDAYRLFAHYVLIIIASSLSGRLRRFGG